MIHLKTVPFDDALGAPDDSVRDGENPPLDALRDFMSHFYTGVSVVTSLDADGRPHGLTCTSLLSVTLTPPTLLVSLNSASGTMRAIRECGKFAVSLLDREGHSAAKLFASPASERFEQVPWRPSLKLGQPALHGCSVAVAECTSVSVTPVGTHEVVLGRLDGVTFAPAEAEPLLYGRRRFHRGLTTPGQNAGPA